MAKLRSRKFFTHGFAGNCQPRPGTKTDHPKNVIQTGEVVGNQPLCREHLRLSFRVGSLAPARPGQFVHLRPQIVPSLVFRNSALTQADAHDEWVAECTAPMLRRAFSIAGLRRHGRVAELDVIYRVVGVATRRMESLKPGDRVSVLGPLGNAFPIHPGKSQAWLISGGVGLPPMLWLAQSLAEAGKEVIAFHGAQTVDLLALTLDPGATPDCDACRASLSAIEFARTETPVVISTDDGSLGFGGYVGAAMVAYHAANPTDSSDLVVYTCGPEAMMKFVAAYCIRHGIECQICMERDMACGTGLCQSCVVAVRSDSGSDDWHYELCCRDGPVFEASRVVWDTSSSA